MNKIGLISLLLSCSLLSHAASWQDFPVQVTCTEASEVILNLAIRPSTNQSRLSYKTPTMAEAVIITSGDAYGPNASSSMTIESSQGDTMSRDQGLTFSGHRSNITRILTYQNYELSLELMTDGSFQGKRLRYAAGKDAFPDTQIEGDIVFNNVRCVVTGV